MKPLPTIFSSLLLMSLLSCTEKEPDRFQQIESLMRDVPESAWHILKKDSTKYAYANEWQKSQYNLLRLETKNKLFLPLNDDSLALSLVDYFEKNGDAKERMRAYYVTGCTYRDMKLYPYAQKWLHKAVREEKNIPQTKENWNFLSRVYGQLAELYLQKVDWHVAIEYINKAEHLAAKSGDVYLAYRAQLKKLDFFRAGNQQDSIVLYAKNCISYFISQGDKNSAASAMLGLCGAFLRKGMYNKAAKCLLYVEDSLDYVNAQGLVPHQASRNNESYYAYKGLYYLHTNKLDSALIYYYRTFNTPHTRISGSYDLARVYEKMQQKDSALKYYSYYAKYEKYTDSLKMAELLQQQARSFEQEKLYSALQQAREARMAEARKKWITFGISSLAILALLIAGAIYSRRNRTEYAKISKEYNGLRQQVSELEKKIEEETKRGKEHSLRCQKLEMELAQFEYRKKAIEEATPDIASYTARRLLIGSTPEAQEIRKSLSNKCKITETQITNLKQAIEREVPPLKNFFSNPSIVLTQLQQGVCLLICASFQPSEIACLLNTTPQTVSTIRLRLGCSIFPHQCKRTKDFDMCLLNIDKPNNPYFMKGEEERI